MAQFYYDWSGYSDWTDVETEFTGGGAEYDPANYSLVSNTSYSGDTYVDNASATSSSGQYVVEDTNIGSVADQEVYLSLPDESPNLGFEAALRVDTTNTNTYTLRTTDGAKSGDWSELKIVYKTAYSGSNTSLASATHPGSGTTTTGWEYRFRANGTDLKAKAWEAGTTEPSSWTVTTSDATLASGNVALVPFNPVSTNIDSFGVGTNGDSAPKTPVSSPSPPSAPTNLSLTTQ